MILIKYTLQQVFKNQLIILIILIIICICQKLFKVLGLENNISIYSIFLYISLSIPELGKLLIPFSLFLSVIITYYQLHIHNEILAMYTCGISKYTLINSVLLCSSIISCIALINLFWLCPYCEQNQNNILSKSKKNNCFNILIEKKFQLFPNQNIVLFIEYINDTKLQNIFIANNKHNQYNNIINVITANQGNIFNDSKNSQSIILKEGTHYNIYNYQKKHTNICITNFNQYQILTNYDFMLPKKTHIKVHHMSINQLWYSTLLEAYLEFNWRLTLLISIFIMPIIALLLMTTISYQYLLNFLLAIILYILFFISHILLRFNNILSTTDSIIYMWLINCIYFIIIICLVNYQNTFYFKKFFNKKD